MMQLVLPLECDILCWHQTACLKACDSVEREPNAPLGACGVLGTSRNLCSVLSYAALKVVGNTNVASDSLLPLFQRAGVLFEPIAVWDIVEAI